MHLSYLAIINYYSLFYFIFWFLLKYDISCGVYDFLSTTALPVDALICNVSGCTDHRNELESYYADLVLSMHSAAELAIPIVKVGKTLVDRLLSSMTLKNSA